VIQISAQPLLPCVYLLHCTTATHALRTSCTCNSARISPVSLFYKSPIMDTLSNRLVVVGCERPLPHYIRRWDKDSACRCSITDWVVIVGVSAGLSASVSPSRGLSEVEAVIATVHGRFGLCLRVVEHRGHGTWSLVVRMSHMRAGDREGLRGRKVLVADLRRGDG